MSVIRACKACRTAKAKCDLVRPTCGRCVQRELTCSGYPADEGFIFRDENQRAQRDSKRARNASRQGQWSAAFEVAMPSTAATQTSSLPRELDTTSHGLRQMYPWLSESTFLSIPEPPKLDLEARAVEIFFVNWTLSPDNDGMAPGFMEELHVLYLRAPPRSVLSLAVRAVAFADMKHELTGDTTFSIKARQEYGASLGRLRSIAFDEQQLGSEQVLAAVLLIDSFESMYLNRIEPLGPHKNAVKHVIGHANQDYLTSRSLFALWCVAQKRLQARQLLNREEPDPEQIEWVARLNIDRPDNRISADVLHMNMLSAAVGTLVRNAGTGGICSAAYMEQAQRLSGTIQQIVSAVETWTSAVEGVWKPIVLYSKTTSGTGIESGEGQQFPMLPCKQYLHYSNVWMAYIWNLHAASQIVLREAWIELVMTSLSIEGKEPKEENLQLIEAQKHSIDMLSGSIVETFPSLLGLVQRGGAQTHYQLYGKMAGRFFSLFSMWVIQRAKCTSDRHKRTAAEVIDWVSSHHGLT